MDYGPATAKDCVASSPWASLMSWPARDADLPHESVSDRGLALDQASASS